MKKPMSGKVTFLSIISEILYTILPFIKPVCKDYSDANPGRKSNCPIFIWVICDAVSV